MNTNNLNHKRVMHMAHILYRRDLEISIIGNTKSDWQRACKDAWRILDVRTAMQQGLVKIYFTKKNGEVVSRIATLNPDHIPGSKMPKGTSMETLAQNYATMTYYDLTRGAWRSFCIAELLSAVPVEDVSMPVYMNSGEKLYKAVIDR